MKLQAVAEDLNLRRSSRLGVREAAGKKVVWDPVTEEPIRYEETGPLLSESTYRMGERLAKQPTSSISADPSTSGEPEPELPEVSSPEPPLAPALASTPVLPRYALVTAPNSGVAALLEYFG